MISATYHFMRHVCSLLILTALLTCSVATAHNSACEGLLSETALTQSQIQVVLDAAGKSDDLLFRVLTKQIGRQKFSIVIMGEDHYPTPDDLKRGETVVREFRRFATEDGESHSHGQEYEFRTEKLAMLIMLPSLLLKSAMTKTIESPMGLPSKLGYQVENAEKGHQPQLSEEVNLMGFAVLEAGMVACVGACAYAAAKAVLTGEFLDGVEDLALPGGILLAYRFLAPILQKHLHRLPLAKNRDITIAANLNQYVEALSQLKDPHDGYRWDLNPAYLVILGRAHLPNTVRLLTEQYGFTESEIQRP